MARVHVVCATQPGPNPGMASVDLGFHALRGRAFPKAEVEYHQICTTAELLAAKPAEERERALTRQALPFEYTCSRATPGRLWEADAVVFWGDFLHMEHYLRTVAQRLVRIGAAPDEAAGRAQALDYFFLRKAPAEALARSLAFGGTLLFDRGPEKCGEDYAQGFSRFMQGARGIWMRDVYSAQKVARERGSLAAPALGSDAALLVDEATTAALPRSGWTADEARGRGAVGLFFGRSALGVDALGGFAQECARRLDAKVHWLPWGTGLSFPAMGYTVRAPQDTAFAAEPLLGDLLEFVSRYRLVVSDTYHLCVTAWKLGVPAICVGQALPRSPNNVNSGYAFAWRDKRQVFYAMHDALDFYVYAEELGSQQALEQRLAALVASVGDQALVAAITQRVRTQASTAEGALVSALKELL